MHIYPSLSDRLKNQHEAIPAIISGLSNGRLLLRPQPGKWNIHDNIAHLASYQPVFIERIKKILSEDKPGFGRYSAPEDPAFNEYRTNTTDQLITQLITNRQMVEGLIANLTGIELSRTGSHKKYGRLNIVQWTEFFLLHEAHHIFTIFQLAHDTELQ